MDHAKKLLQNMDSLICFVSPGYVVKWDSYLQKRGTVTDRITQDAFSASGGFARLRKMDTRSLKQSLAFYRERGFLLVSSLLQRPLLGILAIERYSHLLGALCFTVSLYKKNQIDDTFKRREPPP